MINRDQSQPYFTFKDRELMTCELYIRWIIKRNDNFANCECLIGKLGKFKISRKEGGNIRSLSRHQPAADHFIKKLNPIDTVSEKEKNRYVTFLIAPFHPLDNGKKARKFQSEIFANFI